MQNKGAFHREEKGKKLHWSSWSVSFATCFQNLLQKASKERNKTLLNVIPKTTKSLILLLCYVFTENPVKEVIATRILAWDEEK